MTTALAKADLFVASRWSSGNFWFPARIEVTADRVTRTKRRLFGSDEETISMHKIASVHITSGILRAEIRIESSGGTDPMTSRGHSKADARRIRDLIESYQRGR